MKFYKYALLIVPVFFLSACGGGSDDTDYYDDYNQSYYIDWVGSANGTLVIDATDDAFEFESETGYLHFGSTTYTNAWVDTYGYFYVDGILIGAVYYVLSIDDEVITALVSNNGYYIDIYGPESNLAWTEAPTMPIYAFNTLTPPGEKVIHSPLNTQAAQMSDANTSETATPPEMKMNAYTEELPANTQSTLGKK